MYENTRRRRGRREGSVQGSCHIERVREAGRCGRKRKEKREGLDTGKLKGSRGGEKGGLRHWEVEGKRGRRKGRA